jgi:LysM repeat protein
VDKSPTEKNGHSDQGRVIRPQRKSKTEGGSTIKQVLYTVKRGDNLFEIAQRFNTTPNQIRIWNKMSSKEHIRPGDKLSLKIKRNSLEKI